jgi:hypothetical protein
MNLRIYYGHGDPMGLGVLAGDHFMMPSPRAVRWSGRLEAEHLGTSLNA